jgi:hypothetical protein
MPRVTGPNPEQLPTEAKLLTIFVLDTNDKTLTTPQIGTVNHNACNFTTASLIACLSSQYRKLFA